MISSDHLNFQNQLMFGAHMLGVCVYVCVHVLFWEKDVMKRAMMAKISMQMIITHDTYDVGCST